MSSCAICGGVGLVRVMSAQGQWVSRPCECQELQRDKHRLAASGIPKGYWECSLDTYETSFPGAHPSQAWALKAAEKFVAGYPLETGGKGLLIVGSLGTGKTHLAVGILRRLLRERGATGIFCDYGLLLKDIQKSFNPNTSLTEFDLIDPILKTEVLVLDDLGAQKPSDWVWDNVAHILNTRYNDKLTTIVTTNYPDLPPGGGGLSDPERAARELTLGDRIGERMRSRLAEMCIRIEMTGKDFRHTVKKARFG